MEAVSIVGLTLAGLVLVCSLGYYSIQAYRKERKRRQLMTIRNFHMV